MSNTDRKESIYKKALLALNVKYDDIMKEKKAYDALSTSEKATASDPGTPIEVDYCDMFFDASVSYCASVRDWSFLMRHVYYTEGQEDAQYGSRVTWTNSYNEEIPVEYRGYKWGYEKPDDMLRPVYVDGKENEDWAVDSENIYFRHEVTRLDYIVNDFSDMSDVPELFNNLIASRLAVEISPFIAPDTNIVQRCAQQYQLTLSAIADIEKNNERKRIPSSEEYITW